MPKTVIVIGEQKAATLLTLRGACVPERFFCKESATRMQGSHSKRTLTADEQVAYLKDEKGVGFDLMTEDEARGLLASRDYFFRVKAFAKNFDKYSSPDSERLGQYINLDFGHLVELAELDDALRELALNLALDIEHAMKVRVNAAAMRCGADPYAIASDFLADASAVVVKEQTDRFDARAADAALEEISHAVEEWRTCDDPAQMAMLANRISSSAAKVTLGKSPRHIEESFAALKSSTSYSRNLVAKYTASDMPYWCLMELVSFGPLMRLYRLCFRKGGLLPDEEEAQVCAKVSGLLRCVQAIRNAAAHSDLLLHELERADKGSSLRAARKAIGGFSIDKDVVDAVSRMRVAMDMAATLICYDVLVSDPSARGDAADWLAECRARMALHSDWFTKNYSVSAFLRFTDDAFGAFEAVLRAE